MTTTPTKLNRFTKPTLDTRYHIDFDWWDKADRNLRVYLRSHLCEEHRALYADSVETTEEIDWIDPQTAEVKRLDGLRLQMLTHCSKQPDFIAPHTSIIDAAFRVFLTNNNESLSARELGEKINRDPELILRTLGGKQVYQGLRAI
ncbi:MAG TPA: hypothetical protein VFF70_01685 [Anaerolineae bacterium]|nr:hypothetical protein [Anaerolineae bacterium]